MTTIQNYRDLTLQSTSPRVYATSSDYIKLDATYNQFKVNTSGVSNPTSITVNALLVGNLYGNIVWSTEGGTATISSTDTTCTVQYSNLSTDSITIVATLVYLGFTYTSKYTINKVYDGVNGIDAVIIDLLSEVDVVSANSSGLGYTLPSSNTIKLYKGSNLLSSGVTYAGTATKNGLTLTVNTTTGAITLSGAAWTTDSENFTVTATYNTVTYSAIYSIAKSKTGSTGTAGTNAQYCNLTVSQQAISYDSSGATPSPTTTTLTATSANITTPYYEFIVAGVSKQNTTAATYAYTVPTSFSSMPQQVVVNVRSGATTGTILATDTLALIGIKPGTNGTNGTDGTNGIDGANAISGLLTNESHTIQAANDGTVSSFTNSGGTFKVWNGVTEVTGASVTYSIPTSTGLTIAINTSGVYTISAMSADTATATIRAVYGGVTIDKVYSIAKSKVGSAAVLIDLTSESDVIATASDGTAYSLPTGNSIKLYSGGTVIASGVTYAGTATQNGLTLAVNATTGAITLTGASWTSNSEYFTLTATYNTVTYSTTYTITKAKAGTNGTNGTNGINGDRGSLTGYGAQYVSSSSWSDTQANAVIYNLLNGTALTILASTTHLRIGDTVTLSNGSSFSGTKYWSGASWVAPGTVIDGNLLVTGTLSSDVINANGIVSKNYKTSTGTTRVEINASSNDLKVYRAGANIITLGGTAGNALTIAANASGGEIQITSASNYYSMYLSNSSTTASGIGQIYIVSTGNARCITASSKGTAIYADAGTASTGQAILANTSGSEEAIRAVSTLAAGATANNSHALRAWNQSRGVSGMIGTTTGYDFYAEGASGTNYGPFTGAHDIFFETDDIELGDIIVDSNCILKSGISNTLFVGTKSTQANQAGVVGVLAMKRPERFAQMQVHPAVFQTTLDPVIDDFGNIVSKFINEYNQCIDHNYYYYSMNALGEGLINVCGEAGNISRGDLIVSSSIPGKGMRQSDDIIRSYTVAKAREDVVFEYPEQVIQIACIYLCG